MRLSPNFPQNSSFSELDLPRGPICLSFSVRRNRGRPSGSVTVQIAQVVREGEELEAVRFTDRIRSRTRGNDSVADLQGTGDPVAAQIRGRSTLNFSQKYPFDGIDTPPANL